jgi:hypothetical protein
MAGDNGCFQTGDLFVQGVQLREQNSESLTCEWRQRGSIFVNEQHSELTNTPYALGRYDAEFGKVTSDSIHQHGSLPDQQITRAV